MSTATPAIGLNTPILDQGIRAVNFFNGRLLTSKDLGREQTARRQADAWLGQAIGAGIAWGLEVSREGEAAARIVRIKAGLAVNRAGQTLQLASEQVVTLVAPPDGLAPSAGVGFGPCGVLSGSTYVAGDGLYLLTLAPTSVAEGRAPVLALDPGNVRCNTDATVEAVQLRMLRIGMEVLSARGIDTNAIGLASISRLRNSIAYACFGFPAIAQAHAHPGIEPTESLLDAMRARGLSDCDVPLAMLYLTASGGIVFVDRWTVRRRIAADCAAPSWSALLGEEMDALGEAQLVQFQEQLADVSDLDIGGLTALDSFAWLPPAGFLDATGARRLDWRSFLGTHQPAQEVPLAAGDVRGVLVDALRRDPVRVGDSTRYRVYRVTGSTQWLFVREAPNAPHAEEVWLDGARAGLPGVNNVQAAIDALRARSCSQVVLWPGIDIQNGLLAARQSGRNVSLCFEAGDYKLEQSVRVSGFGHVSIHGSGATLINPKGECALLVEKCQSVTVSGLAVSSSIVTSGVDDSGIGLMGAITVRDTPRVYVERIVAKCQSAEKMGTAGIVVHNSEPLKAGIGQDSTVHISGCEVAVGANQIGIQCVNFGLVIVRQNSVFAADENKRLSFRRGIVIGGQAVDEVRIEDNVIRGVAQGVSVGVSRREDEKGEALQAQRVVVARNSVQVMLREENDRTNRFGLFVGNANSVLAQANRVDAIDDETRKIKFEGLRLTGVYGRQLLIRDNYFDGPVFGVTFSPKNGSLGNLTRDTLAWLFQYNVADGGKSVIEMKDDVRKLVIDEHNVGP